MDFYAGKMSLLHDIAQIETRPNIGSRMNREVHVRIWERPEVRVLRATRQAATSLTTQPWSAAEWIADTQLASLSVLLGLWHALAGILKALHLTPSVAL